MPSTLSSIGNGEQKKKNRGFTAFLKRKKTETDGTQRSNSVLSNRILDEEENVPWTAARGKPGDSSTLPPRSSAAPSDAPHAVRASEREHEDGKTLMIETRKMIAPQNPPPPIPAVGNQRRSPVLPEAHGGGHPARDERRHFKPAANGQPAAKQNGAPQPPPHAPAAPLKPAKNGGGEAAGQRKAPAGRPRPSEVVRRCQQRGFQFNLLCVGETGTGKTTLIESLFGINLDDFEPCGNELNTVELRSKQCEITDSNVNVKLRIVETAGFGDQLDKEKSAKVIVDYINAQFEARLKEELMVKRSLAYYDDKRIHACLYFISPTGHGLKALDVVTMKELSKRVNVIPVIAKSDTTSKDELARFKSKILAEFRNHNIEIYQFPTDDEAVAEQNRRMNSFVPFAVVGSMDFVTKEDGTKVRARRYPWGIVEVENKEHCDFIYLREAILRTNVDALRERTHKILYEAYRRDRLRQLKMNDGDTGSNFESAIKCRQEEFNRDLEKRAMEFKENLKRREEMLTLHERELEMNFEKSVQELEQRLEQAFEEKARLEGKTSGRGSGKSRK
ncbi:Septin-type G domain-containing protein [Aphelenchoides fujianensis]|nr:Septin-type G domain-containing protein [Aphelenchoides fujianensis]